MEQATSVCHCGPGVWLCAPEGRGESRFTVPPDSGRWQFIFTLPGFTISWDTAAGLCVGRFQRGLAEEGGLTLSGLKAGEAEAD